MKTTIYTGILKVDDETFAGYALHPNGFLFGELYSTSEEEIEYFLKETVKTNLNGIFSNYNIVRIDPKNGKSSDTKIFRHALETVVENDRSKTWFQQKVSYIKAEVNWYQFIWKNKLWCLL